MGATVKNMPDGIETETVATPDDPNVGDGFYAVFSGSGPQPFEASVGNYQCQTLITSVIPNSDGSSGLCAGGRVAVDGRPETLSSKVLPGLTDDAGADD